MRFKGLPISGFATFFAYHLWALSPRKLYVVHLVYAFWLP